jgi:hypothetical protein
MITCMPPGSGPAALRTPLVVATGRAASTALAGHVVVRTREGMRLGGHPELRPAPLDGLEPPTQRLGRARSVQLSYRGTAGSSLLYQTPV